jgi:hypothetical protein
MTPVAPPSTVGGHPLLGPLLAGLRAGLPRVHGALTVVPLLDGSPPDPGWALLDEALADGTLRVTEVGGGRVPALAVANAGARAVLLLEGQEVVGAKQNRSLDASILVGAGRTLEVPVSCVEQGRWAARTPRFEGSGFSLYASLRRKKAAWLHLSLLRRGVRDSRQEEVWDDLAAKAAALGSTSRTGAMTEVYEDVLGTIEAARAALAPEPGQVGAVLHGGGRWWGLEVLGTPRLFAHAFPRLLSGYVMEARLLEAGRAQATGDPPPGLPRGRRGAARPGGTAAARGRGGARATGAAVALARLRRARLHTVPAIGEGEEHRFRTRDLVGAALAAEGRLAHLVAFPG